MARNWDDFNVFSAVTEKYLPDIGEGDTMASQIATAVCKLVYKWYNDGDVYDNTVLNAEEMEKLNRVPAMGSVYRCDGKFRFVEELEDDEEEWW